MRLSAPRLLIMALCLSLMLFSVPAVGEAAPRRPYFKTYGADVMSGGWFSNGNICNTSLNTPVENPNPPPNDIAPNYQDAKTPPGNRNIGGIMAFTKSTPAGGHFNAAGGSSSQFAAYVLGVVAGNQGSNFGFYTNGAAAGSAVTGRTFANTAGVVNASEWGGLFQDENNVIRQSYCIPDYFSKKPANYVPIPGSGRLVNGTASGVYYVDGTASPYRITGAAAVNLNTGAASNITIYVNGDAYIDQNITSNVSSASGNVNDIPKFAVVAKGSIYIAPNVTELYGFYVAQPDPANINAVTQDDGVIWTCHDNTTTVPLYTWPADNCNQKLTITGALAAKQVNFLRMNGNVAAANTAEDSIGGMDSASIAEVINYHPAIPMDGPFFTVTGSGAIRNKIDSIISLPPVF